MSTWLITGGAGFIGSNFVRLALGKGHHLVILDALTYAGNLANLQELLERDDVTFVRGSVCDATCVNALFAAHDFDAVIHFAAESHVDRSILGPKACLETNIDGTYTLLQAAREHWKDTEQKRFLHVSTDEVYGSLGPGEPGFTENSPHRPNSPYSASKAAADHLVRAWHHTYGLPTLISNCSNNYGPWQFPEKLIPLFTLNAVEGKTLPVYGDGMQIRDWLHVQDHCEALMAILERGRVGETYVIGGNYELPNLTIIQHICKAVDEALGREEGTSAKLMQHVQDRPGHDRRYAIDATKLREELGWEPRYDFATALPDVVRWYIDHQDWSAAIRSGEYMDFYEQQYGARLS
jgi:dTDP-glucose 4,6-dehydratase